MKALGCIVILLCGECVTNVAAHAQQDAGGLPISFGGKGWGGADVVAMTPKDDSDTLHFSIKAGAATDYVYRGTTLSDRKPAVGAIADATYGLLYAWTSVATVRLPTKPDAELGISGGIRPSFAGIDFDLGLTYFAYLGEARYYDTNFSRESCFVFTGDPNAMPGGIVNPITNPAGLRSNWCSAAFVAKLSIGLDDTILNQPASR